MNLKEILEKEKFKFEKKYGQNFISDTNLLVSIVNDCQITKDEQVLEIGPGAGTLTKEIAERSKCVISYEIDENLKSVLSKTLSDVPNSKIIFKDFMQTKEEEIIKEFNSFAEMLNLEKQNKLSVIANLPYYITTPIIFKLLEFDRIDKITIMVQKEVAERIIAKIGKDYGILSIMIDFFADAKITRIVNRQMFTPMPNVDSAIVFMKIRKDKFPNCDAKLFSKIVHSSFAMRRKTLTNNLMQGLNLKRVEVEMLLGEEKKALRAENLSTQDFVDLSIRYKLFLEENAR